MGTNYYLKRETKPACSCCNRPADVETLHIGKGSGGWCFALHVMPEKGINDLEDWLPLFKQHPIENEYGDTITETEMIEIITQRSWNRSSSMTPLQLDQNYAVNGPNNLVRCKLMPEHCIKHGAGTWDCIIGDFS